jgi:hypothetical protein
MEDFITKISAFATPPLIGVVIWFLVKKFEDGEKSNNSLQKNIDYNRKEVIEKMDKMEDRQERDSESVRSEIRKNSQLLIEVQSTMSKEVNELNKMINEMKANSIKVERWLEESKVGYGKIIYMDSTIQRHEQILISSAKVMRNQNERISKVEADVIDIKKKKQE